MWSRDMGEIHRFLFFFLVRCLLGYQVGDYTYHLNQCFKRDIINKLEDIDKEKPLLAGGYLNKRHLPFPPSLNSSSCYSRVNSAQAHNFFYPSQRPFSLEPCFLNWDTSTEGHTSLWQKLLKSKNEYKAYSQEYQFYLIGSNILQ